MAITLPKEIIQKLGLAEGMAVKVFEVTKGTFAFERAPSDVKFSKEELAVLEKILSFKFEERVPTNVNKKLSSADKKKLTTMVRKGLINLYKGGKYSKTGVYQVPNSVYNQVVHRKEVDLPVVQSPNVLPEPVDNSKLPPLERLEKQGYLVSTSELEAKGLSDQLAKRLKKQEIRGVRGFDKKYYIVLNSFVNTHFNKVKTVLGDKPMTASQVAREMNMDLMGCIALLTVLNEEGEVLEKRKGSFMLA